MEFDVMRNESATAGRSGSAVRAVMTQIEHEIHYGHADGNYAIAAVSASGRVVDIQLPLGLGNDRQRPGWVTESAWEDSPRLADVASAIVIAINRARASALDRVTEAFRRELPELGDPTITTSVRVATTRRMDGG
ncbi:hypothetical protein ACWIGW_31805 [Nocardia brasiliensis]